MGPGWYHAEGDAPGTVRWWDGSQWVGDPVPDTTALNPPSDVPSRAAAPTPMNRMGARAIDLFIMLVILAVLVLLDLGTPELRSDSINVDLDLGEQALDSRLEYLVWGIVSFLWSAGWLAARGATPGKLAMKLRVFDENTLEPVMLKTAAVRSANKLLPIFGFLSVDTGEIAVGVVGMLVIGLTSLVMLLSDKRGRTVMDRLSKTRVVQKH